jgi:hypothetical protein
MSSPANPGFTRVRVKQSERASPLQGLKVPAPMPKANSVPFPTKDTPSTIAR